MPSEEDFGSLIHISPVLTNDAISDAMSKWLGEQVKFSYWEYVGDINKGDSYLSEIMRIKIHCNTQYGESKQVQVYLKYIPKNLYRRLSFRSEEFFSNEVNFYNIVLPALLGFQATKTLTEPFNMYVNPILALSDGINDFIFLEDVSLKNFTNTTRQEGIDIDHCKAAVKALAQFHALSFALKDQDPKEFTRIKNAVKEIYYDERLWGWYERFWKRICRIAIDAVEKEYPDTIYVKKIKEFAVPQTFKDMCEAAKPNETSVISHGDTWTNNFLFRYENGKPVEAKIIDFQLARCCSPVLDLSVLIYACTSQDLRLRYYDEILQYYHSVLSTQIRGLGSDPKRLYSWGKFMDEIKKYSFLGLAFSLESTPMIVLEPEDAMDMDVKGDRIVNIDDVWQLQPFRTKEGRRREADNVVFCVDRGYI